MTHHTTTLGADKATDERALFEQWALTPDGNCSPQDLLKRPPSPDDDTYFNPLVERDFIVWKARAALAAVPASEPIGEVVDNSNGKWGALIGGAVVKGGDKLYAAAPAPVPGMPDLEKLKSDVMRAANQWASAEWADAQNIGRGGHGFEKRCNAAELKVYKAIDALAAATLPAAPAPTEQPAHETIVREGDSLTCTTCGTSAPAEATERKPLTEGEIKRALLDARVRSTLFEAAAHAVWQRATPSDEIFVADAVEAIRALKPAPVAQHHGIGSGK